MRYNIICVASALIQNVTKLCEMNPSFIKRGAHFKAPFDPVG